jgi:hypothetical protein|tara:strand:- start:412 stop:597 length:186 start_codon:yes stop_codon:yes gene_type:complete
MKTFYIIISMLLIAVISSGATMVWAVGLPSEKHIEIETRWLNWSKKDCYTEMEIDLLIEGP